MPGWNGPRKLVEPDELQPAESEHLTYEQIVALIDRTASPAWVRVSQALLGKRTIVLRGALERILSGPQPSSGS